jgi:hypothetical protein
VFASCLVNPGFVAIATVFFTSCTFTLSVHSDFYSAPPKRGAFFILGAIKSIMKDKKTLSHRISSKKAPKTHLKLNLTIRLKSKPSSI